ncbi:MAG: DUF262 domain-containing protein [Firmicutes bacterium]|nr:DUF262 domain-containing protein [Bacillota bacterium]
MAFQTPLTIKEVIDKIHKHEYLLPSIQREFVWRPDQVINLFDSLLKEYPINSFLFWKVQRNNVKEYIFYEFMRTYNQLNNNLTKKADVSGEREITAILDGQQRLTSLYIALKGSYATRKKYGKKGELQSYPDKKLFLNLLRPLDEDNENYELSFLEEKEANTTNKGNKSLPTAKFWFPISKILDLFEHDDVQQYINDNLNFITDNDVRKFASKTLFRLHKVIFTSPLVSYFLEEDAELEKVLSIFIRVNSGGTPLNPSDLLFSFANSHWTDINFKDSVNSLVGELNSIGMRFYIDKAFVMKSILYLSDSSDISAKVDNFTATNMQKFKDNWDQIIVALRKTFKLVSSLGFNGSNLRANNIFHPIAYYLFKNPNKNIETGLELANDRNNIRKWIVLTSLKRFFSFAPDGALRPIRELIRHNTTHTFPIDSIVDKFKGGNRSLSFSNDDIDKLLTQKKDDPTTFVVLSILYPNLNYKDSFHIDHMYPKAKMKSANLSANMIDVNLHFDYLVKSDQLPNLQLLEGSINQEKSDMDFSVYCTLINDFPGYSQKHYIPKLNLYGYVEFLDFYEQRKTLLKDKLLLLLS